MATIKKLENLEIWQLARQLCNKIFILTAKDRFSKDFGLKGQIKDSSASVMDNIAEGFGRGGNKEFVKFLSIAIGSCNECQSQLYRALDWKYINDNEFKECYDLADTIIHKSGNLIDYLNKSKHTGKKYKDRPINSKRQTIKRQTTNDKHNNN